MKNIFAKNTLIKSFLLATILFICQTSFAQYIYIEDFNTDDNKGWIYNTSNFTNGALIAPGNMLSKSNKPAWSIMSDVAFQ